MHIEPNNFVFHFKPNNFMYVRIVQLGLLLQTMLLCMTMYLAPRNVTLNICQADSNIRYICMFRSLVFNQEL